MSFTAITKPTEGDPTRKSTIDAIIDDLAFLYGRSNTVNTIVNPSFEDDTDADGIPDAWTRTLFSGGSFLLDNSTQTNGVNSVKFTSPGGGGNGGGRLDSADPFPVSPNRALALFWEMISSAAGVSNKVEIFWYKSDLTASATPSSSLYSSTSNPTSWTAFKSFAVPPSDARFAKVRLTGCSTASSVAGSTWFDNILITLLQTVPTMEVLTTSGNWTCPVGVHFIEVQAWGGGGSGGSNTGTGSGAGGGGEYATGRYYVTPGTIYAYLIGAGGAAVSGAASAGNNGGNTSLGSLIAANGGTGGTFGTSGAGGAGGTGGAGGMFIITGQAGDIGTTTNSNGGGSPAGGGGGKAMAGIVPGGGGGAGVSNGFAGADGRIVLRY